MFLRFIFVQAAVYLLEAFDYTQSQARELDSNQSGGHCGFEVGQLSYPDFSGPQQGAGTMPAVARTCVSSAEDALAITTGVDERARGRLDD